MEFAEGTLDLSTGTWFCLEHSQTLMVGKDCPFCAHESLSESEFNQWALTQH